MTQECTTQDHQLVWWYTSGPQHSIVAGWIQCMDERVVPPRQHAHIRALRQDASSVFTATKPPLHEHDMSAAAGVARAVTMHRASTAERKATTPMRPERRPVESERRPVVIASACCVVSHLPLARSARAGARGAATHIRYRYRHRWYRHRYLIYP